MECFFLAALSVQSAILGFPTNQNIFLKPNILLIDGTVSLNIYILSNTPPNTCRFTPNTDDIFCVKSN